MELSSDKECFNELTLSPQPSSGHMTDISVVVPTGDEELHVEHCLDRMTALELLQISRQFGRVTEARARSASSGCIVRTVLFGVQQ